MQDAEDADVELMQLVSSAIQFLASVAERPAYKQLFADSNTLTGICEKVIVPNMEFRGMSPGCIIFWCCYEYWLSLLSLYYLSVTLHTLINPLSLRFNGHFPDEPGLAGVYWSKGWWRWWWQLCTGAISSAKLQSNAHHQRTNIQYIQH